MVVNRAVDNTQTDEVLLARLVGHQTSS